jgi:hypothetical protein
MNKKLLIVFALGVIVYVVWKKSKETGNEDVPSDSPSDSPSSASEKPFVKSPKIGAIRGAIVKKVGVTRK